MDIHEHQAKELLRDYNIPTPNGKAVFSVEDALLAAKELPGPVYVVKAQIHAGGRGKAGGVKVVNDLEAVKNAEKEIKYYQASSSEMFGGIDSEILSEQSQFNPKSPYAVGKVFAHEMTKVYRESYGLFCVNGILFNHESPLRGETFVTRKITRAVGRIFHKTQKNLTLGNMEAKRDWGFAGDYVEMQWRMLQQEKPEDFVVATGRTHSVKDMISLAFSHVGMTLSWSGEGVDTIATDQNGEVRVRTNPKFFRPAEVDLLIGDASLSQKELGWVPETSFEQLVAMMVDSDMKIVQEAVDGGYTPPTPPE